MQLKVECVGTIISVCAWGLFDCEFFFWQS